jgi:hypothetical protein
VFVKATVINDCEPLAGSFPVLNPARSHCIVVIRQRRSPTSQLIAKTVTTPAKWKHSSGTTSKNKNRFDCYCALAPRRGKPSYWSSPRSSFRVNGIAVVRNTIHGQRLRRRTACASGVLQAYWKDPAIFSIEGDAQSGPDHVASHRSVALATSPYNRPGALIHKFHNTVSMTRAIELLLGIAPMNQLDASAIPMDIFQETPDLTPRLFCQGFPRITR